MKEKFCSSTNSIFKKEFITKLRIGLAKHITLLYFHNSQPWHQHVKGSAWTKQKNEKERKKI